MLMHNPVLEKTGPPAASIVPSAASQLHVAIICDGNGHWATSRALPRSAGHRAGAQAARRVIRSAPISTFIPSRYLLSPPPTGHGPPAK